MQGNIDFIGQLTGDISGGGGGGGDVMDVKVKTSSQYISVVDEEDKTAYIDLSGYATKSELSSYVTSEALTIILNDYVTDSELSTALGYYVTDSELSTELTSYQPKLTAGANITIDPNTNVISASSGGGGVNYSTSEQDTGDKWIDGRSIYIKTIELTGVNFNISQNGFRRATVDLHTYIPNADIGWIVDDASYILEFISDTYYYRNFDFWEWEGDSTLTAQYIGLFKRDIAVDQTVIITVKYVKGV